MPRQRPSRIVCLSAEAVDVLYRLGCGNRIVGVTAFSSEPAAAGKPRVSGFSTVNFDRIDALEPDLIITFSDVQADATAELLRRGHTVLATNQRSLAEIYATIELIGRTVGRETAAKKLVERMRAAFAGAPARKKECPQNTHLSAIARRATAENTQKEKEGKPTAQSFSSAVTKSTSASSACSAGTSSRRPRVYFEEWPDPLISGICWVSELIEAAGGRDIFPELQQRPRASDRVVSPTEIICRQPDIIFASWCGKKVDLKAICSRSGWDGIPAVQNAQVYEIESNHILQPGPAVLKGFTEMRKTIRNCGA